MLQQCSTLVNYMHASLAIVFMHIYFLNHISEYNQAIAGEYGAGSRGMCMLHAPSNNGLYSY